MAWRVLRARESTYWFSEGAVLLQKLHNAVRQLEGTGERASASHFSTETLLYQPQTPARGKRLGVVEMLCMTATTNTHNAPRGTSLGLRLSG